MIHTTSACLLLLTFVLVITQAPFFLLAISTCLGAAYAILLLAQRPRD